MATRQFLLFADIHANLDFPTGCSSDEPRKHQLPTSRIRGIGTDGCDSPLPLLRRAAAAATRVAPDAEMALVAGDLVSYHEARDLAGAEPARATFRNISHELAAGVQGLPTCLTLGNNDVWPDHIVNTDPNDPSFYAAQADAIQSICPLSDSARESFTRFGYYAVNLGERLKLVVINTAPYDIGSLLPYWGIKAHLGADPFSQLAWLNYQLANATASKSKVLILGHIPPGIDQFAWPIDGANRTIASPTSMWHEPFEEKFWQILTAHARVIGGLMFGHKHTSDYRIWGGSAAASAPPLLTFGAVAPVSHTSPAFYVLEVDRKTDTLSHVRPYHLNLTSEHPQFEATAILPDDVFAGGISPLTNENLARRTSKMMDGAALRSSKRSSDQESERDWSTLFGDYYRGPSEEGGKACVHADDSFEDCLTCTGQCRLAFTCQLLHGAQSSEHRRRCGALFVRNALAATPRHSALLDTTVAVVIFVALAAALTTLFYRYSRSTSELLSETYYHHNSFDPRTNRKKRRQGKLERSETVYLPM